MLTPVVLALGHLDLSVAEYAALLALPGLVAVLVTVVSGLACGAVTAGG